MSDYGYDEDEFDQGEDNGPKGLRAALKKAQADLAAQAKANEALTQQLADLAAKDKARSLGDLLATKGVSPKLAKFIERDGVDATDEAVSAWLDENADVFNIKREEAAPQQREAEQDSGEGQQQQDPFAGMPEEFKAILAAMQQSQQAESAGASSNGEDGQAEAAVAAIGQNAQSEADITASLKALGLPIV